MCALGCATWLVAAGPGLIGDELLTPRALPPLPSENASLSQGSSRETGPPESPHCPFWTLSLGICWLPWSSWLGTGVALRGGPVVSLKFKPLNGSLPLLVQNRGSLKLSQLGHLLNLLSTQRKVSKSLHVCSKAHLCQLKADCWEGACVHFCSVGGPVGMWVGAGPGQVAPGVLGPSGLSPALSPQELEAALHHDDAEFISDLIACLLQGCYQRRDIT